MIVCVVLGEKIISQEKVKKIKSNLSNEIEKKKSKSLERHTIKEIEIKTRNDIEKRICLRAIQLRVLRAKMQGNGEKKNEVNKIQVYFLNKIDHSLDWTV